MKKIIKRESFHLKMLIDILGAQTSSYSLLNTQ